MESVFRKGKPFERTSVTSLITSGLSKEVSLSRTHIYAGDAGYCSRKSSIIINIPKEYTSMSSASGALYMAIGKAMHEQIQEALEHAGVLMASEFRIDRLDINLGGLIDAIIRLGDEYRIVEIKTCGALPSKPKPEHKAQALVYSLVTGIKNPLILYVSRSVANYNGELITREFTINATEDELMTVAIQLYRSEAYAMEKALAPIPTYIYGPQQCGFCPFQNMCFGAAEPFPVKPLTSEKRVEIEQKVMENAQNLVNSFTSGESERYLKLIKELGKTAS